MIHWQIKQDTDESVNVSRCHILDYYLDILAHSSYFSYCKDWSYSGNPRVIISCDPGLNLAANRNMIGWCWPWHHPAHWHLLIKCLVRVCVARQGAYSERQIKKTSQRMKADPFVMALFEQLLIVTTGNSTNVSINKYFTAHTVWGSRSLSHFCQGYRGIKQIEQAMRVWIWLWLYQVKHG